MLPAPDIWVRVIAGAVFMVVAVVIWRQGQKRRSVAWRWFSVMDAAWGLCAWLSAAEALTGPQGSALWGLSQLAALVLALCAFSLAGIQTVREAQRVGSAPDHC